MARIPKTIVQPAIETPKQSRTLPVIIVLAILLMLAVAIAGYFYYQYKNVASVKSETDEITSLTKTLGAMIELPEGEVPTLATVTDRDKLAEQPFFQKAENGDKMLIYTNSGRAVLYRPSTGKIVDVTTVNVNQPASVTAPADTTTLASQTNAATSAPVLTAPETQSVKVALYNGSTKIGVTNTLENEIKAAFDDVEVIAKDKAAKNDYQGNLVIDLSLKNADLAKSLAESIAGTVGLLPLGETVPTTDILIIVGNK